MTMESAMSDLKAMELLFAVYEEMGAEDEPELEDFISPYRRVVGTFPVLLKEAAFATAEGDEAKVYVMNDILLIGLDTKKLGKKGTRQKRAGTLDRKTKKGTLEIKKGTLTKFKGNIKLLHYLDLRNCKLKSVSEDAQGFHGVQLTHVSRVRDTSSRAKPNAAPKVVTKIAKIELWLPTKELCDELESCFLEAAQELLQQDEFDDLPSSGGVDPGPLGRAGSLANSVRTRLSLTRSNSVASSGAGASGERQRKWATGRVRRSTLEKQASTISATAGRRGSNPAGDSAADEEGSAPSRSGSIVSAGESASGESVGGGLQLSDLEKRYNMDLKSAVPTTGEAAKAEIEVEFGEGRMGLSLGSGSGIGVIVGALAPGGFAEMAGVLISDRVCAINDEEIGLDDHWQDALDKFKQYPRPIRVKFERFAARTNDLLKHNKEIGTAAKGPATKGQDSAGTSRAKARELQKILLKTERIVGRGDTMLSVIASLSESAEVKANADNRSVAAVLDEIARTELAYLHDLGSLVRTYVLPLRNERVKTKCRHIDGAGVLCEHGLRSTCLRSASEHQPLVSAAELQGIFLNVETIMFVNSELLRTLQMKLNTISAGGKQPTLGATVTAFAESFTTVMPFFKSYSYFCHEYANAVDRLLLLRKDNRTLGAFLSRIERAAIEEKDRAKRVQSLSSLLIKPVQRICKYPLLFAELLKHASPGMPGRDELEHAARSVERIAESVNQKVGESKQFERFMEVYRDLGGEDGAPGLVTPSRRFVLEEDCMVTTQPFSSSAPQPRTIFLFNDLIVVAKGEAGTLTRAKSLKRLSLGRSMSVASAGEPKGTIERSWSRLIGVFTGRTEADEPPAQSTQARKASLKRTRNFKLLHRFELSRLEMKEEDTGSSNPVAVPTFTLLLTVKERVLVEAEPGAASKGSPKPGGTEKWKTNINKYRLTFDTKELRDRISSHIEEQMRILKELGEGHQKGESLFGVKKEKRNWAKKSNGTMKAKVEG